MQIDLDVQNVSAQTPGAPCRYNGHLIIHCEWFGELHAECVACGEEYTEDVPAEWHDMGPNQQAAYWVKKIGEYDEPCPSPAKSMKDVVEEDVMNRHLGKIATAENRQRIENEVEASLPDMFEANVSFDV